MKFLTANKRVNEAAFIAVQSLKVDSYNYSTIKTLEGLLSELNDSVSLNILKDYLKNEPLLKALKYKKKTSKSIIRYSDETTKVYLLPTEIYKGAVPATVLIKSSRGQGSGVCYSAGLILTNQHVVNLDETVEVTPFIYKDGKAIKSEKINAKVIYRSRDKDFAVLKLENIKHPITPITLNTQPLTTGSRVYTLGSPRGLTQSLSEGLLSAQDRDLYKNKYLQHTAPISPGNSGGPLLDSSGALIGINTLGRMNADNIYFAIPISSLIEKLKEL